MNNEIISKALNDIVELRQLLTKNSFGIKELMRIYVATPLSDYFKQDAYLNGYVSHQRTPQKKHLKKRNYN